jgi:hypothetical protein
MTDKQRLQYDIRYILDNWQCQNCGKPAMQIAHRIANTKTNRKVFGNKIDNNVNLVSVCSLECNDSYNIGNNPGKCEKLIQLMNRKGHMRTAEIDKELLK